MREGLRVNPRLVNSITEFPVPHNVSEVRRFLGLTSYYRKFVCEFAGIAQLLHRLTCTEITYQWTDRVIECHF